MGAGDGGHVIRIAKDPSRAGWAAQRGTGAIVRDELQRLRRVVRGRTWLSHVHLQSLNKSPLAMETIECSPLYGRRRPLQWRTLQTRRSLALVVVLADALAACGPRTHFRVLPAAVS